MRRVIINHPKTILLDAIVDGFGNFFVKECIDSLYLEILELAINGEYELEFVDSIFKIDEGDVFKNLEKLKENPLYKDKIIIKKVDYQDILEYTNQNKPPIDLDKICNFFNIKVEKKEDLFYDGLSKYENNQYFIIYKSGITSPYRERFTIAHELGHIFLHFSEDKKTFIDEHLNRKLKEKNLKAAARGLNHLSDIEVEREANNFAADLLMPKEIIFKYLFFSPKKISNIFKVSKEAVEIRLKTLGMIPYY